MYLTNVRIENIKCFEDITLHFKAARQPGDDRQQNWNVILGDNGDGKTTLLRAIASCLMDVTTAQRILRPEGWVREGKKYGRFTTQIKSESGDLLPDRHSIKAWGKHDFKIQYLVIAANEDIPEFGDLLPDDGTKKERIRPLKFDVATIVSPLPRVAEKLVDKGSATEIDDLSRSTEIFTRKTKKGWISLGYGPFRRAFGPANATFNITDPLEERFITLFEEGAALYKYEEWLKDLERLALKNGAASKQTFETVKQLLIELLPGVNEIKIEERVRFVWDDKETGIEHLSDGYRSMFVMMVDLLRWLEIMRSDPAIPLNEVSGVVLIDEVDAHLHPKWQREIGFLLPKTFPNIQFIVTTHSPFVAMASGKDALTVLLKNESVVIAQQDMPHIQDWAVDEVISQIFGEEPYSQKTTDDLSRYEELRFKKRANQLAAEEENEFSQLESDLNQRLEHDPASPKQQAIAEDLAYLKSLLKQKQEKANAAG